MIATYDGSKLLNVRSAPRPNAPVVRRIKPGQSVPCVAVEHGWVEMGDGYARADYMVVTAAEEPGELYEAVAEAPKPAPEPEPAPEPVAEPAAEEGAELMKMTNAQLYALAEQSGISVRHGATKKELVAAILADA